MMGTFRASIPLLWLLAILLGNCAGGCSSLAKKGNVLPTSLVRSTPTPSHDRLWKVEQSSMPVAQYDGTRVQIRQVREARWRTNTDRDLKYGDWSFRWDDILGVDFITVPFKDLPMLAHTMLSFPLRDGRAICVSVEARLEEDEVYSPIAGTGPNYELIYVIGDEEDLLGLRAVARTDDVYLYPSKATPQQAAALLRVILDRANGLRESPEFYHSVNNNCTTNLISHLLEVVDIDPDQIWSRYVPGMSTDRWAYDLGLLASDYSFAETRRKAWVSSQIRQFVGERDFSQKIRSHIESPDFGFDFEALGSFEGLKQPPKENAGIER